MLNTANGFSEGSDEAYAIVKQMSFGKSDIGGSSSYGNFPYSEYVTEDLKVGETFYRKYKYLIIKKYI